MPAPQLECVPNVSEGRDLRLVDRLAAAITSVPGTCLVHRDVGRDANRTVFTFLGPPEAVRLSAKRLARACVDLVDLRGYAGTHPYVGALDVCPFVPLWGLDPALARAAAEDVGAYLAGELGVPVYFYEESARRERFRNLARVRRGGLASVPGRPPEDGPDLGGPLPHPSAGVSVVGARGILVAYNVNLATADARLARAIARELRGSLPAVRAIGWYQAAFGCCQVSCNLLDYRVTDMATAYAKTGEIAARHGTSVAGSELIGMAPAAALRGWESLGLDSVRAFAYEGRVLTPTPHSPPGSPDCSPAPPPGSARPAPRNTPPTPGRTPPPRAA